MISSHPAPPRRRIEHMFGYRGPARRLSLRSWLRSAVLRTVNRVDRAYSGAMPATTPTEQSALVATLRLLPKGTSWSGVTERLLEYASAVAVWQDEDDATLIPDPAHRRAPRCPAARRPHGSHHRLRHRRGIPRREPGTSGHHRPRRAGVVPVLAPWSHPAAQLPHAQRGDVRLRPRHHRRRGW